VIVTAPGNPAAPETTIPRAFLRTVARQPDAVALRAVDPTGSWARWTWTEVAGHVARLSAGLAARGIEPGDRIVFALRSRPEFPWLDLAAQFRRAVPVSLYRTTSTGDPPKSFDPSSATPAPAWPSSTIPGSPNAFATGPGTCLG